MKVHPRIAAARERSRARFAPKRGAGRDAGVSRLPETLLLLLASAVTAFGLFLVYQAKAQGPGTPDSPPFSEMDERVAEKRVINVGGPVKAGEVAPLLDTFPAGDDRTFAAQKIEDYVRERGRLANVGALSSVRVEESEVDSSPLNIESFRSRLERQRQQRAEDARRAAAAGTPAPDQTSAIKLSVLPLLSRLKPSFVVRTPREFRNQLLLYFLLYLLGFYAVHMVWMARGFTGDTVILPTLHLLSGLGLVMTVSLFDPLRDLLYFPVFAQGTALGCATILLLSFVDFQNSNFRRLSLLPLAASFLLSVVLIVWGQGPAGSNAKVNLSVFGIKFQPVEAITRLLVLFLAAYFAQNWEFLRELKEERGARLGGLLGKLNLPRLGYLVPVVVGMVLALLFFLLQQDLGPALVMFCTFLALYGVARRRAGLVTLGLAALISAYAVSYKLEKPATIRPRIDMWLSPWENESDGGDQLVRSLWALASGSVTGTGLGLGDADEPGTLPAAHTDMIISSVGEELGFGGVLAVFVLFAVLVWRGFQIALRAPGHYTFFLALGLTVNAALQFLLITGGATGVVPLSGVVLPFLSFGRTALVANFAAFGVLLAISARAADSAERTQSFRAPVRALGAVLGVLSLVVIAKAAYVQVVRADELLIRKANVVVARRGRERIRGDLLNPRLEAVARTIERGSVYDRTGLPLVTSKREELMAARERFSKEFGINVEQLQPSRDGRYRPFGGITFHLLGGLGREDARLLRGYTDERELLPLLRYRHAKEQPEYRDFVNRDRNLRLSIDAGLQFAVARILEARLGGQKKSGAAVVVEPRTGELLASVSYPWPTDDKAGEDDPTRATPQGDDAEEDPRFDKARLGRYPPGSTFKIVTAIAALRKDPALESETYECRDLGDGAHPGARFGGFTVRDSHTRPDGDTAMRQAIIVSCNAYFAQLGFQGVGAKDLFDTAKLLRVERLATPDTPASLRELLGHAAYGQGEVEVSPLTMARVAATVAAGGVVPPDVFVLGGPARGQSSEPRTVLSQELAAHLASYMHDVVNVVGGTAWLLRDKTIAGKTGTAEVEVRGKEVTPHAWFMGFAPFDAPDSRRIAFSVLVVRGGWGASAAAPIAQEIVAAARARKLIK